MTNTERWEKIEGASDYMVSCSGKVSSKRKGGLTYIELKQNKSNKYLAVSIVYDNGKRITKRVHRLVACSFIDNPENLPQVAHVDGNRLNNSFANLRWSNQADNEIDKKSHGTALAGDRCHNAVLTKTKVLEARFRNFYGESIASISRDLKASKNTIRDAVRGKTWKDLALR